MEGPTVYSRNVSVVLCFDGFLNFTKFGRSGSALKPSECFQFACLTIPSIFLLVAGSYLFWLQHRRKQLPVTNIKFQSQQLLQLLLALCCLLGAAVALCSILLEDIRRRRGTIDPLRYIALSLDILSLFATLILTERQRRCHQPRSETLFSYWLLLFLSVIPRIVGLIFSAANSVPTDVLETSFLPVSKRGLERIQLYALLVYMCSAFAHLLTQCFSPHNPSNSLLSDKNACPELWVSVPSLWCFTWLSGIIWEAFRGRVQRPEDVFSVRPIDAVEPNFRLFRTAWEKCIARLHPRERKSRSVSSDDRLALLSETDGNPGNLNNFNAQQEAFDGSVPTVAFRPSAADRKKFAKTGAQDSSLKPETGHKVEKPEHAIALLSALGSAFGGRLLVAWLFLLISTLLNYASPIFLGFLLRFLASTDRPDWEGYLIAIATILLSLAALVCDQRGFYRSLTLGISLRSVLTSAIYRKSLRLSSESRAKYTTGELLNLLSVDVNRIMESFMFSFLTWTAIIQFILSFVLLWRQLGPATLAGIGCMFLLLPLNVLLMWFTQKFEASEMKWKDKRLKCLGEVFGAIKVIKLYAWEKAFQTQADSIRTTELSRLVRVALGWGLGNVIWNLAPFVILLTTFVTFTWSLLLNGETSAMKSNATATMPMFLDPERIFVSVSLFNLLRAPLILLPWSLSAVIMAYVSVKRIGTFLLAPELDQNSVERSPKTDTPYAVEFKDGSFSWTKDGPMILQDINFQVQHGWLVAIVGSVGAGKSSVLLACLGEMVKHKGSVKLNGTTAYVPQSAWIQQQTLRANVCFTDGSTDSFESGHMNSLWYETVISACALQPDLEQLPAGDLTEIGERGVNLSGGQRQRVSLARAVYQDCDIYLLDDPLSAVDAHVGQHIFAKVIGPQGILKHKTRLITTNSFNWLNLADWLIVLNENGEIVQSGTYQDIVETTHGHFSEYLQFLEQKLEAEKTARRADEAATSTVQPPAMPSAGVPPQPSRTAAKQLVSKQGDSVVSQSLSSVHGEGSSGLRSPVELSFRTSLERTETEHVCEQVRHRRPSQVVLSASSRALIRSSISKPNPPPAGTDVSTSSESCLGRFVEDEEVAQGHVPWLAYTQYILARGWLTTLMTFLVYGVYLGLGTFANFWLQWFADDADLRDAERSLRNETIFNNDTARMELIGEVSRRTIHYVGGYGWMGLGLSVLVVVYILLHITSTLRASKLIHQKLLSHVLRAPMSFFDRNPMGRILNRFSNDMDQLDHKIPDAFLEVLSCFGDTVAALLVVIIALQPFGLGFGIVSPFVVLCGLVQFLYLPCSRQARRLDAVTRSPLLSNFGETAASSIGVTVVRAFDRTDEFSTAADRLTDQNAVHSFLRFASNRWLDVQLTLLNRLMLFITTMLVINGRAQMTAGLSGLLITYATETAETVTWMVKQWSQLETSAISLERIREYMNVESEASWEDGPDSPPPPDWPSPCCQIVFNKTTVIYESLKSSEEPSRPPDEQVPLLSDFENPVEISAALRSIELTLSGQPALRRVGIVGRTGAGKSSLAGSIFRIVEPVILDEDRPQLSGPFTNKGPIIVDGVDILRIGLHELRSRFNILPQEPVLFSGSLRFNLDPFGARADHELWSALEAAHLTSWMRTDGIDLDYECGEAGCNLSVGQRQLVCLARVFLSSGGRVRLLILDEATAAMDPVTDNLVMQTVVGNQFKEATVLIIAHRLSTVLDTDMIVVLDHGRVVETGRPQDLLADSTSRFSAMYQAGH
ncbi:hypothetical protein CRM22_006127 [Opisthorchis felineus]|uniref:ABC-type glutathione-S-conjugate transporter n=2 Tax=Opisthorchis felineus TaxID=147828 RepID=A0A4S2LMM0_OPIFE|nr:hypothetical protein CRM22_006127 [Opisthorchis felineus]TGZ64922.1 hypothetical protein CRM22_006127 [Opisthorchis felineus]